MKPILMLVLTILCIGIVYAGITAISNLEDRDFKFKVEEEQGFDLSNCSGISVTNLKYGTYRVENCTVNQIIGWDNKLNQSIYRDVQTSFDITITQEDTLEIVLQLREEVKKVTARLDELEKPALEP